MSSPESDMTIRAMVAELASFHAEDVRAILDVLTAEERQTIETFLHEHRFDMAADPAGGLPDYDESQLSTWLRQALEKVRQQRSTMTVFAQQALLKSAAAAAPWVRS
jgi:hypothetical protein